MAKKTETDCERFDRLSLIQNAHQRSMRDGEEEVTPDLTSKQLNFWVKHLYACDRPDHKAATWESLAVKDPKNAGWYKAQEASGKIAEKRLLRNLKEAKSTADNSPK